MYIFLLVLNIFIIFMIGVIFVDDMSEVVNKFSEILKDKDIDLNEVLRNFSASSNNSSDNSSTNNSDNVDNSSQNSNSGDNIFNNIDFETIMKFKTVMDKLNSGNNNPRSKLLLSLKPYLKDSRKNKLDQYIQLFNMTSLIELFNKNGGDKK